LGAGANAEAIQAGQLIVDGGIQEVGRLPATDLVENASLRGALLLHGEAPA